MEPYEGRAPYIFISYARKDKERVTPYLNALSGAGYRVWYDKGIKAGDDWLKKLEEKVTNCALFCPIFSHAFNDSYYCFRETAYACWRDKKIVPLYLEELGENLRLMFRLLKSLQHLRLDDCAPAQFAERLERQPVFALCKESQWHKIGEIQWRFSETDGVLSIAQNEALDWWLTASIPSYQIDPCCGNAAPWAPYWEKILSVEIADYIDKIGDYAFYCCYFLTKAYIGDGVTKIGNGTFAGCENLTDVCIPDRVTEIGESAFAFCENLADVRIPDSVTKIGELAFLGCDNLKSVEISDRTEVADSAFPKRILVTRRAAP